MKTRSYFTIEYFPESGEPEIPTAVIEFDEFTFNQKRPVHHERDAAGNTIRLVPDPVTTTVITGTWDFRNHPGYVS